MTPAFLEAVALRYLERFDATRAKLQARLERAAKMEFGRGAEVLDPEKLQGWIEELLDRYRASGVIDDRRYAERLLESQRARGASARAIVHKLRAQKVDTSVLEEITRGLDRAGELEAALRLVKRRRLGAFRPVAEQGERYAADLARLARAGFGFDVAKRALGAGCDRVEYEPGEYDAVE
ncbi:MAG TPA: RecX family transcriptional regulator [Polyangiaceae bacterium]|nr:RecX family transcriptional regulator [Polyangiaceae bacterium]